MEEITFTEIEARAHQLFVYNKVLADPLGRTFLRLLRQFSDIESTPATIGRTYSRLFRLLAQRTAAYADEIVGDAWQNHLLERILDDINPFSSQAGHSQHLTGGSLELAAHNDLGILQHLFNLNASTIFGEMRNQTEQANLPLWDKLASYPARNDRRTALKKQFLQSQNWQLLMPQLVEYYAEVQIGVHDFVRWKAFRWQRTGQNAGYFEPVQQFDEARLENLIGYDRERAPLIQNTAQFLAGLPANHALLYGARGTGKSSTIKALLARYADEGLRLVEVHKEWLSDYPLIASQLRKRPEKFILFVDDLSFEAEEFVYKDLKALLEGGLEARPANLLIYATSNRRHLIKEQFSDNPQLGEQNEIQAWDTVEEKLSLADRFGLVITFTTPSQRQYLDIVYGLAKQAGLHLPEEQLRIKALQWETSHSGRSGRVARQFIDQLTGELGLQNQKAYSF